MIFLLNLFLFLLLYPYFIYPLLLLVLDSFRSRPPRSSPMEKKPAVSVLIPVYNEQKYILEKLNNLNTMTYSGADLTFCFGTDGCTDRSADMIREFMHSHAHLNIVLHEFRHNRGKTSVLNDLVQKTDQEILVFTDATTIFKSDTIEELVVYYSDESIIGICGEKTLSQEDGTDTGKTEGFYWRFESYLKRKESRLHSVLCADGPVFSMRRSAYPTIKSNIILDDLYLTLKSINKNRRFVYNPQAVGYERSSQSYKEEYIRRKRLATGAYQFMKNICTENWFQQWSLITIFCLISHKVLRWLSPFLMIGFYLDNSFLVLLDSENTYVKAAFLLQNVGYLLVLINHWTNYPTYGRLGSLINSVTYLVVTNLLQLRGVFPGLSNKTEAKWSTVNR
jgi:biofilm PGA synthesis N-glycosyltransferase PgaC